MGYRLRHLPGPRLVEVTARAVQRRFLLRPSAKVNAIIIGALARAQRKYGMKVCYCVYLSNHAHLLLWPDDSKQLADFMRYAHSKIAKELGRTHDPSDAARREAKGNESGSSVLLSGLHPSVFL